MPEPEQRFVLVVKLVDKVTNQDPSLAPTRTPSAQSLKVVFESGIPLICHFRFENAQSGRPSPT